MSPCMIGFTIGYAILTILASQCIWRATKSKVITGVVIVLLLALSPWDNILGRMTFSRLCKEEGGLKIYKKIDNVEGFYYEDGDHWSIFMGELFSSRYKFIEANITKTDRKKFVKEPGLHRFYVAKKGDPNCKTYNEVYEELDKHKNNYLRKYPKEICIASEEVQELKSRYSFKRGYLDHDHLYVPLFNINKSESTVTDLKTGEVLGSAKTFYYYGGWLKYWYLTGPVGYSLKCPEEDTKQESIHERLLHEVLIPAEHKEQNTETTP